MKTLLLAILGVLALPCACAADWRGHLDTEDLPAYLRDRGEGVATSLFATFIQKGQFIVYPFFEYYLDSDFEYKPSELGFSSGNDYRGDYRASEELLFVGYGLSDDVALEIEAAIIQARLERSSLDESDFPDEIEESGLGDVEGQLRWRWARETARRPEFFSYLETVFPTQDSGSLIGTTDWEFVLGTGLIRGFSMGTVALRVAAEYDRAEDTTEVGELAFEYFRRLSPRWRVYGAVEGSQDEWELITEAQVHVARGAFVRLNNAFGLTSKATDWAPEVGVVLSF